MDSLIQDVRYAVRAFARAPGFTAVAVLVLALGIGVNTTVFSLINALLFRTPAVRAAEELRYVYAESQKTRLAGMGYVHYQYLLRHVDAFSDLAAFSGDTARLRTAQASERARGERVSSNYFDVLGIEPALGRTFLSADDERSAEPAMVISADLWVRRFHSDSGIIGKQISLDDLNTSARGRSYTIIGVVGPDFKGMSNVWSPTEYWVPVVQRMVDAETWCQPPFSLAWVSASVGRLRPGATTAQAEAAVGVRGEEALQLNPPGVADTRFVVHDARKTTTLPFVTAESGARIVPNRLAAALSAISALVLLIAAANLAGVLMARIATRGTEIGVRLTLGATRWRLVRQFLTEGMVLSLAGGLCGLALAQTLVNLFLANMPAQSGGGVSGALMNVSLNVSMDGRVLLFTSFVCLGVGLLLGLLPAWQASNRNLSGAISHRGIGVPRQTRLRLRYWIVVPQVCFSLALLLVASLLVRTLLRMERADSGYDPDPLVYVQFLVPGPGRCDQDSQLGAFTSARQRFNERVLERAQIAPAVTEVGLTWFLPLERGPSASVIAMDDFSRGGPYRWITRSDVTPGYFEMLKIPLLRGRTFDSRDVSAGDGRTAIISESLATLLWPGKDPIGRNLAHHEATSIYPPRWHEIVGIVKDVKPALSDGGPNYVVYLPPGSSSYAANIVGRGNGSQAEVIRALRTAVTGAGMDAEVISEGTVTDAIAALRYPRRVAAAILAVAGALGLLLAAVGLYGVVWYLVVQRVREIGVRTALGADRRDIIRLMIGEGITVLAIGGVLGVAVALAATRIMSATIAPMPSMDAVTLVSVPALIAAVILLACYIPARRATGIDPVVALRTE